MALSSKIPNYLLLCYLAEKRVQYTIVRSIDLVAYDQIKMIKVEQSHYFYCNGKTILGKITMMSNNQDKLLAELSAIQNGREKAKPEEREEREPIVPNTYVAHSSNKVQTLSTIMYPIMSEDSRRNKMYILGPNGTAITERSMSRILWNDYVSTTNELLYAVFGAEILRQIELDPYKLEDIIYIVTNKYKIKKKDVQGLIEKLHCIIHKKLITRDPED